MNGDTTPNGFDDDVYELDGLLGAYALDALDPSEVDRVEDYLRINPRADAEVRQHREVATMLAFTGMDAPDDIWSRISDEIEVAPPEPGPRLAELMGDAHLGRPGVRVESSAVRRFAPRLAAAAAVGVIVVGAFVVGRVSDSDDLTPDPYDELVAADGARSTRLVDADDTSSASVVVAGDGRGLLDGAALPTLGDGRTYQLWGQLAADGSLVSIGVLGNDPDLVAFTADIGIDGLVLTIEEAPGSVDGVGDPDGAYAGTFG